MSTCIFYLKTLILRLNSQCKKTRRVYLPSLNKENFFFSGSFSSFFKALGVYFRSLKRIFHVSIFRDTT